MNQMRKSMMVMAATVTMEAVNPLPPPLAPPPPPLPPVDVGVGNIDAVGLAVRQLASCVDVPLT
jgi:hypothetical protein